MVYFWKTIYIAAMIWKVLYFVRTTVTVRMARPFFRARQLLCARYSLRKGPLFCPAWRTLGVASYLLQFGVRVRKICKELFRVATEATGSCFWPATVVSKWVHHLGACQAPRSQHGWQVGRNLAVVAFWHQSCQVQIPRWASFHRAGSHPRRHIWPTGVDFCLCWYELGMANTMSQESLGSARVPRWALGWAEPCIYFCGCFAHISFRLINVSYLT